MHKLVDANGESIFPIESKKVDDYLSYTRIGNIVIYTFNRTFFGGLTSGVLELYKNLPFRHSYASRVSCSLFVGSTCIGHCALDVNDSTMKLFKTSYGNDVTVLGSITCIITE